MNLSLGLWIVVAVLAAWAVGAHSRFKRLRSLCRQAHESLLRHLEQIEQRAAPLALWAQTQAAGASVLVPAQDWLAQVHSVVERSEAIRQGQHGLGALAALECALGDCLRSVQERCPVVPADPAGELLPVALVESLRGALHDAQLRLARYNAYVQEWNAAVQQAPASWLARVAGMRQEPLL